MCGFVAIYTPNRGASNHLGLLKHAGSAIQHRGPDDQCVFSDDYVSFYFARLSVRDLKDRANQPFFSEDKDLVMVFNGEIYNSDHLRDLLISRGHAFRTKSDTEVLLRSYEVWGEGALEKLRGMFAFIIWDRRNKVLFYARDRFGIKPLYFHENYAKGMYIFSSEIKGILQIKKNFSINWESVFRYVTRAFSDDGPSTFYKEIFSVEPGVYGNISASIKKEKKYWSLGVNKDKTFDPVEFRSTFMETVGLHMEADVPICATISGGLDSSSIVTVASKIKCNVQDFRTYSVVPPMTYDERPWIDDLVKQESILHSYVSVENENIAELIDTILNFHDEPFQYASCVYQFILRKQIAQDGYKVLLVGEGADEILGGYRRMVFSYILAITKGLTQAIPSLTLQGAACLLGCSQTDVIIQTQAHKKMLESGQSGQENTSHFRALSKDALEHYRLFIDEPIYKQSIVDYKQGFFDLLLFHIFKRNLPYVLKMEDLNSMAFGIESRVPFVDHVMVEMVMRHSVDEFMRDGENKSMLRRAMQGLLPTSILNRKSKSNRPGSHVYLMTDPLMQPMIEELSHGPLLDNWMFAHNCKQLFENDLKNKHYESMEGWFRLFVLSRWMRKHA